MDMLGAILEGDCPKLESLVMENIDHINDPIGMPFETPNSRFFGHPIMTQMVIGQHPDQTLLDVACGMPCGPGIWVLLSFGAKGSRHPLGTDLALHNAIKNGRPYTVQALLRPGRSEVNGVPGTTWKPLLQAVFWNHPEIVRILLRKGANLEDAGLSPRGSGYQTALQLCLDRRAAEYHQGAIRERCNEILRQLLEAGANIHVAPPAGSTTTPFEMFTQPFQTTPFWAVKLTVIELDCLRMFVNGGANLQIPFDGCPCGSARRRTFEHQVLWHSTPNVARLVIDSLPALSAINNSYASALLHEVLGSCPEAKRHPADTLRDVQVLLQQGVDPNIPDSNGVMPLRKCIEQCPAVDLVVRLQMLLDGGANPELEDSDGIQAFVLAARTFEEPLLSEVMQALVSKMSGGYTRIVNGVSRIWSAKHFPIGDTQTYEQVMSSTRNTGDFKLEMQDMVPEDIRRTFERAYFTVVSKKFLDSMTRTAKSRMLTPRDKEEIVWVTGMRRGIDIADYRFDQELVIALLDPQPVLDMPLHSIEVAGSIMDPEQEVVTEEPTTLPVTIPEDAAPTTHPRAQWQFNPNNTTTPPPLTNPINPSGSPNSVNDDDFIPGTTLIRWHNPESQPRPGDLEKACASVLRYECATCNDGVPLTKKEQERHGVEHAHTEMCNTSRCSKRFCLLKSRKRGSGGCQDYLFGGDMVIPSEANI
jgi:ankyrin repeat protein